VTVVIEIAEAGRYVTVHAERPSLCDIQPGTRFYELDLPADFADDDTAKGREIANFAVLGDTYADEDPQGWAKGVEALRELSDPTAPAWMTLRLIEAALIRAGHYSARTDAPMTQNLGVTFDHPQGDAPVSIVPMPSGWQLFIEDPVRDDMFGPVVAPLDATADQIATAFMNAADTYLG
jgi:hypothetical protein